jgi:hypothetical protein
MSKLNDNLSDILDVEPISESEIIDDEKNLPIKVSSNVIEDDTNFARTNIKAIIEKSNTALDDILKVAKESEHPRAYEVAANFLKTVSDMNKDLLELQKTKKSLEPKSESTKNINVDKAVFIGSTAELLKQIRESK